ncbi:MAG: M20 family metallopeptidase [Cyclobacteriaceae bacterium]|jgi:amidohydrolase
MALIDQIKKLADDLGPQTVQVRRHLHAHPELSYQEHATAALVEQHLTRIGLPVRRLATTGVVSEVVGGKPGRTIALRADMDALPIQEKNDVPYRSTVPGVMHACGHDVHTSSLLATAAILAAVRDQFAGTVRLIFQPGEEKNPGGASIMISEGVLQSPQPSSIMGQHVMPLIPAGQVGFREGMYMASSDEVYLRVIGKGGHAGAPHLVVDPVVIAANIIVALQQVVSRQADPRQPTTLNFGKVVAQGATNIVPEEVTLAGTFRALNESWREAALEKVSKIARGVAEAMGGSCEVKISRGYPYLENDVTLTRRLRAAATQYVGEQNVVDLEVTLGSEDFAYYSHVVPACFYRLGTGNVARGITSYVHTPTFDIDESALHLGPGLMAWMAIQELQPPA